MDGTFPQATWATLEPCQAGLDPGRLEALAAQLGGRGCIVRHGRMVCTWGDTSLRADIASAAKPIYTHLLLKAVEDGHIASLDDPVATVEPRLGRINAALGHKDRRITWRHLAGQTACYGVAEPPGSAFDYNDWQMALLWDCLFLKVYGATYETVDEQVLRPLLTDILRCQDDPTMMAFGPGSRPGRIAISVRDFARFGLLYLREGTWNGRQAISRERARMVVTSPLPAALPRTAGVQAEMIPGQRTIGSSLVPDNQTDHFGSYSWLWWINGVDREGRRHWPGAPADAYGAFGHGGVRALVIVPSLDLVASWNDARIERPEQEQEAIRRLAGCVVGSE